jgi:hypothetical protein
MVASRKNKCSLQKIPKAAAAKDILNLLFKKMDLRIQTKKLTPQQLAYTWHLFDPSFDRGIDVSIASVDY